MVRKSALTGLKPGKRPREEPAQEGGDKVIKSPKTNKAAFAKKTAKKSEEKKKLDKLEKYVNNGKHRYINIHPYKSIQFLPIVGNPRGYPRKSKKDFKCELKGVTHSIVQPFSHILLHRWRNRHQEEGQRQRNEQWQGQRQRRQGTQEEDRNRTPFFFSPFINSPHHSKNFFINPVTQAKVIKNQGSHKGSAVVTTMKSGRKTGKKKLSQIRQVHI